MFYKYLCAKRREYGVPSRKAASLALEELESRFVPDAYRWAPAAGMGFGWSTQWELGVGGNTLPQTNWIWENKVLGIWVRSGKLPDEKDDVSFGGWDGGMANCVISDTVKVHSISVGSDYLRTIMIKGQLELQGQRI